MTNDFPLVCCILSVSGGEILKYIYKSSILKLTPIVSKYNLFCLL
jgi:hypothetical protein